jgi:hypothetical protein
MSVNIEQEILDWFNEPEEQDHLKKSKIDREVWYEFYDLLASKESAEKYGTKTATLASGPAYVIQDEGGAEGDGEHRHVVFSVADQFFMVTGYYASWDGTTWDDPIPFEVFPQEVTVIEYTRKQA